MTFYRITSNEGQDLGIYKGADEDEARASLPLRFYEIVVTVVLSSSGMGDATEEAYDDYCNFVEREIDERVGFEVNVERARYGLPGRRPLGQDTEACDSVAAALIDLWGEWCDSAAEEKQAAKDDAILGELAVSPLEIDGLRDAALVAGDKAMVAICDRAEEGDDDALREVRRVLEQAEAMGE
jgi:hypothetical protein